MSTYQRVNELENYVLLHCQNFPNTVSAIRLSELMKATNECCCRLYTDFEF